MFRKKEKKALYLGHLTEFHVIGRHSVNICSMHKCVFWYNQVVFDKSVCTIHFYLLEQQFVLCGAFSECTCLGPIRGDSDASGAVPWVALVEKLRSIIPLPQFHGSNTHPPILDIPPPKVISLPSQVLLYLPQLLGCGQKGGVTWLGLSQSDDFPENLNSCGRLRQSDGGGC